MRRLLCSVLPLALLPLPGLADVITTGSAVTAVTLYPQGARITRDVTFTAPAGRHDLRIADLPTGLDPEMIRISADGSAATGGFSLQEGGLGPAAPLPTPDLDAAIAVAQADRDAAALALEAIDARIEAAEAQIGFLRAASAEVGAGSPDLAAIAKTIGAEVLATRQAMAADRAARPAQARALDEADLLLQDALSRRDDRRAQQADKAQLAVAVTLPEAGEAHLTVVHYIEDASWRPIYDANLTRKPEPALVLDRGALVSQGSGEDWRGVALTLSTARPGAQAAPSDLWPELLRVEKPQDPEVMYKSADGMMEAEPVMVAAAPMESRAMPGIDGDVVVYRAPAAADVASGVEDLRIALGEVTFAPKVEARAVPRADATAFVVAEFDNGAEVLLPGRVMLSREGALVGATDLGLIAAKAEVTLPFGAIDGLKLTREMPQNLEGDAGFLSSDTARSEVSLLRVENLTEESWPVHLVDQVPYSEQAELQIDWKATPAPAETEPDGQRGLLGWRFDLAPGARQEVRLEVALRWPEGLELR